MRGEARHPVNFGHLGPKGENGWRANNDPHRGTTPMLRRHKGAALEPVGWEEALDFFVEHFRAAWSLGHEALACYNSGQLTIEEFYTLGKLWRGGLQSSNIDGNTRLCTATAATGLMSNFGADGPVASYTDIDQADLICIYGHNVAEVQTVLWERMLAARQKNGARIIAADPRKSATVRQGADLHLQLLTGAIGRPGAGPLLMAGQPSAMSNREAGADGSYPGYRNPHNPEHMRQIADLWNLDFDNFHPEVPKDIITMLETAERGEIEFMWVIGTNPLVSLPDQNRTRRILEKLFVVVQDPFVDADSVALADLYLPVSMWGEKTGCVTNADRTVNLLLKAVDPPGGVHSDFEVFIEVANRLGFQDKDGQPLVPFRDPADAFEEWKRVSAGRPCNYSGMTYELILQQGAIRWPCNEQHPLGSERLYEDLHFWTGIDECETYGANFLTGNKLTRSDYERIDPKGKAFLKPAEWRRQPNPVTAEYPYVLSTGRVVYHFHTRTKTGRSAALNDRAPHAYVEIHPDDAARLGITMGDRVEVASPHGRWEGPAIVVDTVRPGELFIPFHYGHGAESANQHTWYARDPVSQQPQFKSSPVDIRKITFGTPEHWLLERYAELAGHSLEPYAVRPIGGTIMTTPNPA